MKVASRPLLRRLAHLHRAISAGEYPNAFTVARELEVNPRTVYRDIDFLRDELNAPVEFCPRRNGYYYREGSYTLPLFELTEGELIALFLAERVLQHFHGSPFVRDLEAAFRKLTAGLPETVTLNLAHLSEACSVRVPDLSAAEARRFARLVRATQELAQLEVVYWTASREAETRRIIDPYHLVSIEEGWYLVAYCHLREEIRMFVPGRMRSLQETGEHFERPAGFRIEDYLDGSFGAIRGGGPVQTVRLRFSPHAAQYVREKVWHPSQKMRTLRDGSVELVLRVNHFLEVEQWVLSYGSECEVLEPEKLREKVASEMRRALQAYEQ
jgi:predicted DNA-binding transcriptional regulator YafY